MAETSSTFSNLNKAAKDLSTYAKLIFYFFLEKQLGVPSAVIDAHFTESHPHIDIMITEFMSSKLTLNQCHDALEFTQNIMIELEEIAEKFATTALPQEEGEKSAPASHEKIKTLRRELLKLTDQYQQLKNKLETIDQRVIDQCKQAFNRVAEQTTKLNNPELESIIKETKGMVSQLKKDLKVMTLELNNIQKQVSPIQENQYTSRGPDLEFELN